MSLISVVTKDSYQAPTKECTFIFIYTDIQAWWWIQIQNFFKCCHQKLHPPHSTFLFVKIEYLKHVISFFTISLNHKYIARSNFNWFSCWKGVLLLFILTFQAGIFESLFLKNNSLEHLCITVNAIIRKFGRIFEIIFCKVRELQSLPIYDFFKILFIEVTLPYTFDAK